MNIKEIDYSSFGKCIEIKMGNKTMVVSKEFGPRILHFSINDNDNILFTDDEKSITNNKGWYMYGGHRLWLAPEGSNTYNPDNQECKIEQNENEITFSGYDPRLKLELKLTIYTKNNKIFVKNSLLNTGNSLDHGGIWAITCVKPEGIVFIPWSSQSNFKLNKIIYWQEWMGNITNITSKQYIPTKDLFLIEPTGEIGKVGTAGHEGFIGITNDNYTFIKKFKRELSNNYPDDNCAIECYLCDRFIELETLGPNTVFMPDIPVEHIEEWILIEKKIDPYNGNEIRKIVNT